MFKSNLIYHLAVVEFCYLDLYTCKFNFLNGISDFSLESCDGESKVFLDSICMKLPEEKCLPAGYIGNGGCGEHEFHCGDGQCIHGLGVCDEKYQCLNGHDESLW